MQGEGLSRIGLINVIMSNEDISGISGFFSPKDSNCPGFLFSGKLDKSANSRFGFRQLQNVFV